MWYEDRIANEKESVQVHNAPVYKHAFLSHPAPQHKIPLVDSTGSHLPFEIKPTNVELGCLRQSEGISRPAPHRPNAERRLSPFELWRQIRTKTPHSLSQEKHPTKLPVLAFFYICFTFTCGQTFVSKQRSLPTLFFTV